MSEIIMIQLDNIDNDEDFNCRDAISTVEVNSLAKSILEHAREVGYVHEDGSTQEIFFQGLIQPVTIRKVTGSESSWQLVAGYRRRAAFARIAQEDNRYTSIPAIVVRCTDLEAFRMNLTENIQRKNLNLKEEAGAVGRLRDLGLTQQDIAKELGMSRGWVQVRLYMYELPDDVQDEVVANNLTVTMIRELWQLPTNDDRRNAIHDIKLRLSKGIKVREVKTRVRPKDRKLIPKKDEVLRFMEIVADNLGWGITTRMMSWCIGEITDGDIESSLVDCYESRMKKYLMLYELKRHIIEGEVLINGVNISEDSTFVSLCEEAEYDHIERVRKEEEKAVISALKEQIANGQVISENEPEATNGDT